MRMWDYKEKLNVRGGKDTVGNTLQSAQSTSHLNQPESEPTNKISTPNTVRYLVLKYQGRDKDTAAKEPTNKIPTPNTVRHLVLKHQARDKDIACKGGNK